MNSNRAERLALYVPPQAAHECGHMAILFKAGRLRDLNFFPHRVAEDGTKGVLETDTRTELRKEDCVALAGSMIGELIWLGKEDSESLADDRKQVQLLAPGQPLENFALGAYEVLQQNLLFFALLYLEVQKKMFKKLIPVFLSSEEDYAKLEDKITIFTLAEVEQVCKRAESTLARFSERP